MKINWFDVVLIILGIAIIYQLIRKILGGSWQTESIIISLLFLNLGLTWRIAMKLEGHMIWHRIRDKAN